MITDLSAYNKQAYTIERSFFIRALWHVINSIFFCSAFPFIRFKLVLLKLFGASIGRNVVIKPRVNIKYPWKLSVGDNSWIGEGVWLDSLGNISVGKNCCISQGAKFITGNHDYKQRTFDLLVHSITLEDGVWIGCGAIVCGDVICGSHSVLTAGSVASKKLDAYFVYTGNPATKVRKRIGEQFKKP